jgi:hypothetical protein
MGETMGNMCKCDNKNICGNQVAEIISQFPREVTQNNDSKFLKKNKEQRNSLQISGKITQFLSSNKIDGNEEDNNLLNSEKNSIPSNNVFSNRSNVQNISQYSNLSSNLIKKENNNEDIDDIIKDDNKVDSIFEHISIIEDKDSDKKNLFDKTSKKNLRSVLNILNQEANLKDTNPNNKNKNGIKEINKKSSFYAADGINNEGKYNNGKLNGFDKFVDEDGTIYEGVFEQGILNGNGKIIKIKESKNTINKIVYRGNINNFKKEGYGTEICDEYIYEGNFQNNKKKGKGKIQFLISGDSYEGEFDNDKITGYGHYIWSNNHEYIGDFVEGEMHGKGKYIWPDGNEYEGEYIKNIKEGNGKFKWSNGAIFEGKFHDGKADGKGIMNYKGYTFDAEFKNGHFEGDLKAILKELKNKNNSINK